MKSFTERNPYVIGATIIVVIAIGTGMALLLNGGFFKSRYTVYGDFTDAAGIKPDAQVKIAGIPVGVVGPIETHDGKVRIALKIDKGTKIPRDSRAEIRVDTLLGTKSITVDTGDDWKHLMARDAVISDTRTPVDLLDLQDTSTPLLQQSDAKALNSLMQQLSAATEGKHADVKRILDGLGRLTTVVNDRQSEARDLIDSARTLSGTLADRNQDLIGAVQNLDRITRLLVDRRNQLADLLASTADTSERLAKLVHQNRPALDNVINELHADLTILSNHQVDLAQSVSLLSSAIRGFASVGYSGPNDFPNHWANIYAQAIGPLDTDALYGSCGLVDKAMDLAIGPDPRPCDQRSGPIPGGVSGNASGSATPAQLASRSRIPLNAVYGPLLGP